MKRLFSLPIICLLLVPAYAQSSRPDKRSAASYFSPRVLEGIPAFGVLAYVNEDVEALGLRRADIQRDVEVKLRVAGIPFVAIAPGLRALDVSVDVLCTDGPFGVLCGFNVDVSHRELVRVVRGDSNLVIGFVTTWKVPNIIGTTDEANLQQIIRGVVKDAVDEFINAYLTANPKQ